MGQAPGIRISRIDVGGSRAGTQTGFEAFGFNGQARVQVDGVNTTEGTGSAGFYYDYGSFDEIQIGADGNDASSSTPGVQLNAVIKSGGNQFRGTFYSDYEREAFQGKNVDARLKSLGIGAGSHILTYHDINGDVGGPIRKDKLWYYTSLRRQDNTVTVTGFPVESPGTFGQFRPQADVLITVVSDLGQTWVRHRSSFEFGRPESRHQDLESSLNLVAN
jgi:hypothetical protein